MIVMFLFSQAGRINAQANDIVIIAASLLLAGFGIYQIRNGITGLVSN